MRRAAPWLLGALAAAFTLRLLFGAGALSVDGLWSLHWGRDLLHLRPLAPSVSTTPHPLTNLAGLAASALGRDGDVALLALGWLGGGALVAATARLGLQLGGPAVAAGAALLMLTRPELGASAAIGVPDPWAAALTVLALSWALQPGEATSSRQRVAVLLAIAGLLRPEAWVLGGLWFAWRVRVRRAAWRERRARMLVIAPILVWTALDTLTSGDPLLSLHRTGAADQLLRASLGLPGGLIHDLNYAAHNLVGAAKPALAVAMLVIGAGVVVAAVMRRPERGSQREQLAGAWLASGLLVAMLLAEAALGALVFARFGLAAVAIGCAAVPATVHLLARSKPHPGPAWAVAALGVAIVSSTVPALSHTRDAVQQATASERAVRAAMRAGLPCAPVFSDQTGWSIWVSTWAGVPLSALHEAAPPTALAAEHGSFFRAPAPLALSVFRDQQAAAQVGPIAGPPATGLPAGWQLSARCTKEPVATHRSARDDPRTVPSVLRLH